MGLSAEEPTQAEIGLEWGTPLKDLHFLHRQQDYEQQDRGLGAVGDSFPFDVRRQRRKWKYSFGKFDHRGVCGHPRYGDGYEHRFGEQLQRRGRTYAERRDLRPTLPVGPDDHAFPERVPIQA